MQIAIDNDGTTRFIHNDVLDAKELGAASIRRASHVLPRNRLLRAVFRWLRDTFGEKGIVAAFTRRWPCVWIADMSPLGGGQYGPFRKRADAIRFEIAWIEKNWL